MILLLGGWPVLAGAVEVRDAWARATPPGAKTAAVYLTLVSDGESERLLGAGSDVAEEVQMHSHLHENGMMKMQRQDDFRIPAGEVFTLKPGGDHLMLVGLQASLVPGDELLLQLEFERAGVLEISVPVVDARGGGR
jgi:copper(I)-binding protein